MSAHCVHGGGLCAAAEDATTYLSQHPHAGLNTALESLSSGESMMAGFIAYDQPGVAARVA